MMHGWTNIARIFVVALIANWWLAQCLPAQIDPAVDHSDNGKLDFARDVQPIFGAHCYSCHGPEKQESNFRLDMKSRALDIGDFGDPPIIPGNGNESPLIRFVSGHDPDVIMPPDGAEKRLDEKQIATLRRWIDQGADWPDDLAGDSDPTPTTDHWSFQPIVDYQPPEVDPAVQVNFKLCSGIDHFVAQRLSEAGIQPSPPADRVSLIRRIYLDMHGLQPTPEQVKAFVEDESDDAYSKLIDDVLASEHYGQRWARHWLDIVRFGESTGYEVNRDRSNAYYYRDYVIDSLNEDKSYRDFIIEQLAGDVAGVDEATGFLVGGPNDIVKSPDINLTLMQRQDELADYVNTTSTTFLGLTVGCARCHNHKFDPILQRDYYSLQAVFAGVEHGERKLMSRMSEEFCDSLAQVRSELQHHENLLAEFRAAAPSREPTDENLLAMINAKSNSDLLDPIQARFLRFTIHRTNASEPCIDELEIFSDAEDKNVALASCGSIAISSGNYMNDPKHQLQHINDGIYGNDHSWISDTDGSGWVQIELPEPIVINRVVWGRDREGTYTDRLAIDYSISVSFDGTDWQEVSNSARREPFLVDGKEPEDAFISRLTGDVAIQARQVFEVVTQLRDRINKLEQSIATGYVGNFKQAESIHRLYRGDPMSPREEVAPIR